MWGYYLWLVADPLNILNALYLSWHSSHEGLVYHHHHWSNHLWGVVRLFPSDSFCLCDFRYDSDLASACNDDRDHTGLGPFSKFSIYWMLSVIWQHRSVSQTQKKREVIAFMVLGMEGEWNAITTCHYFLFPFSLCRVNGTGIFRLGKTSVLFRKNRFWIPFLWDSGGGSWFSDGNGITILLFLRFLIRLEHCYALWLSVPLAT